MCAVRGAGLGFRFAGQGGVVHLRVGAAERWLNRRLGVRGHLSKGDWG